MTKTTNFGKRFEQDWAKSVPQNVFYHRLKDSAQSYNNSENTEFSWDNPYDCMMYNGNILFCLELKSTSKTYMAYQIDENDKSKKMIKWHQIKSLTEASEYKNMVSGFILNFRLDDNNQLTYFFNIKDFNRMRENINKKSFNIMDAVLYGAQKIEGFKKRTRWSWHLDEFLESQSKQFNN